MQLCRWEGDTGKRLQHECARPPTVNGMGRPEQGHHSHTHLGKRLW